MLQHLICVCFLTFCLFAGGPDPSLLFWREAEAEDDVEVELLLLLLLTVLLITLLGEPERPLLFPFEEDVPFVCLSLPLDLEDFFTE